MRGLLEWALDLDAIRLDGGADIGLRFQTDWPAWALALLAALLLGWVVLIYRRDGGPAWGRILGATLRIGLLGVTLALALRPLLLAERDRVEPSHVILLVDDSASTGTSDRYEPSDESIAIARAAGLTDSTTAPSTNVSADKTGSSALSAHSRADLLRRTLTADDGALLAALAERNRLCVYAFSARARQQTQPAGADDLSAALDWLRSYRPAGRRTDVAAALRHVLTEPRAARIAAVVLASDGRSTADSDLAAVARLASERKVPVHAIRLGSGEPRLDIAVGPARAEETVFVRDMIAVTARVSAEGLKGETPVEVLLLDGEQTLLTSQQISLGPDRPTADVELRHRPTSPGRLRLLVRVEPVADESNPNNNTDALEVRVLDEKVKVLYVEEYPRYEYRFLKNALIREETITASCLLLSADEGFAQEGDEPIKRFPVSMEELEQYDLVILGDVDPRGGWLSPRQMEHLVEWVGRRGGGFLMIAGTRHAPHAFLGTPPERLIPVRVDAGITGRLDANLTTSFQLRPTPEGFRSSLFRFEVDPQQNKRTLQELPGMFWHATVAGASPGAEVLAEHPVARTVDGSMPLLVISRFGAGTIGFAGVEETWRWRRDVGGRLFDAYWLQLVRRVTRGELLGRDRRFALRADRPTAQLGESVTLVLNVLDETEAASLPNSVRVEVVDAEGAIVARPRVSRLGKGSTQYEGTFVPTKPGSMVARLSPALMRPGQRPPVAMVRVEAGGPELQRLEPDHQALEQIAERTGGKVVGLAGIKQMAAEIGDRSLRIPDDLTEPLWDTKLVLALFVLIITGEWVLRKALGLV